MLRILWTLLFFSIVASDLQAQTHGLGSTTFEPFRFILAADPQIGFGNFNKPSTIADDRARFILQGQEFAEWNVPFALIAGDMVHRYWEQDQVDAFDQGLATYEKPTYLVPGNHDFDKDNNSLQAYRDKYGPDYYSFSYNNVFFVGLNSELWKRPDDYGTEPDDQLTWLQNEIGGGAASSYDEIFVFMHYPPFRDDESEPEAWYNIPPAERPPIMNILREAEISALLVGHVHESLTWSPDDNAFPIISAAGTATTFGGPLGYQVINVSSNGFSSQIHALGDPVPVVPEPTSIALGLGAVLLLSLTGRRGLCFHRAA